MPHDEIEDEIPQDIISITIEQSVSTAQNALYVCLLPFSILTAPLALFGVWVTMFYTIYTNLHRNANKRLADERVIFGFNTLGRTKRPRNFCGRSNAFSRDICRNYRVCVPRFKLAREHYRNAFICAD